MLCGVSLGGERRVGDVCWEIETGEDVSMGIERFDCLRLHPETHSANI